MTIACAGAVVVESLRVSPALAIAGVDREDPCLVRGVGYFLSRVRIA